MQYNKLGEEEILNTFILVCLIIWITFNSSPTDQDQVLLGRLLLQSTHKYFFFTKSIMLPSYRLEKMTSMSDHRLNFLKFNLKSIQIYMDWI